MIIDGIKKGKLQYMNITREFPFLLKMEKEWITNEMSKFSLIMKNQDNIETLYLVAKVRKLLLF